MDELELEKRKAHAADETLVIVPTESTSFSDTVILDARFSSEMGFFGERLAAGKRKLKEVWREYSKKLSANSNSTDIFGALAKASLLFEETPDYAPRLVLLSDMRQAHGNYLFEKQPKIPPETIDRVEKDGLIPPLKGAQVWVLGTHALGVSQTYWMSLRDFWTEYFKRAQAQLMLFTQNRRWPL